MNINSLKFRNLLSVVSLLLIKTCCLGAAASHTNIFTLNKLLARTINIGYVINSDKNSASRDVTVADLSKIKQAGFTAVRFPIQWAAAASGGPSFSIDPELITKVDRIVRDALKLKLAVILDNHADEQLMGQPEMYKARFFKIWEQLALHYQRYPQQVMFELMAEPHGNIEKYWNNYLAEALAIVRKYDPERPVIIGPGMSNRPQQLSSLQLPEDDKYIIVTFHQYSPIRFTMQGERWFPFGKPMEWLGTKWPLADDEAKISLLMDGVAAWAAQHHRPVFMGEFGVSSNADELSAINFIKFHREEAEKRAFSWGYWSCFGLNFNLFDEQNGTWKQSYLNGLIPGSPPKETQKQEVNHVTPVSGITANAVLEGHIAAIGGQAAINECRDIELNAAAALGGQALHLQQIYVFPDGFSETIKIGDGVFQHSIVKPGTAGIITQGNGQQLTATDKEFLLEKSHLFLERYLLTAPGYTISFAGKTFSDGINCYQVVVSSPLNRHFQILYDINTGLRQKIVYVPSAGDDFKKFAVTYKDYRLYDRLMLPGRVINDVNDIRIDAIYDSVKLNTGRPVNSLE